MDVELDESVPKKIKAVLHELVNIGIIGLSRMKKLRVTTNNNNLPKNKHNSHSFILEIPYAGTYLSWEVIFSNEDMSLAPDFDFVNDQFLIDPDIDVIDKEIPSLHHWNLDDPRALYRVVQEIMLLYKKYQVDRLQVNKYHRQFMEYQVLIGEMGLPEDNIEVLVDPSDCVHFLLVLPTDVSVLPPYLGKYFDSVASTTTNNGDHTGTAANVKSDIGNPGAPSITLRVSYLNPNKVQTCVWLSPNLEEVIGNAKLHIPCYNKDMGLIEYIPTVRKLIKDKLEAIAGHYKKRNEFVSTMLAYQGNSIVEYDNVMFCKMTLLLEVADNHCLLIIQIGKNSDKPTLQLRSLYCERNNKPLSEQLSYAYSADLSVDELVKRILFAVRTFMKNYNKNCKQQQDGGDEKRSYADTLVNVK